MKGKLRTILPLILVMCLLVTMVPITRLSAANGKYNALGHLVTYDPAASLYVYDMDNKKLCQVNCFDRSLSAWNSIKNSKNPLSDLYWKNYELNKYGKVTQNSYAKVDYYKEKIEKSKDEGEFSATISYEDITSQGNMKNMRKKGDLQFFFGCQIKTVHVNNLFWQSHDYGKLTSSIDGKEIEYKGGGVKNHYFTNNIPNLSGGKWSSNLSTIKYKCISNSDDKVDAYYYNGMLVAKDVQGPKINSIKITSDVDGKNQISGDGITLNQINNGTIKNRTIYFNVEWDEPVRFKSGYSYENLSLTFKTIGKDGTSGTPATAYFLKYYATRYDDKPVMIFEYKIPEGTDAAQYYKIKELSIYSNENSNIWNNVVDFSGNPYGMDSSGNRPAKAVTTQVSGVNTIDLEPFAINKISVTRGKNTSSSYIQKDDKVTISLELNKAYKSFTSSNAPEITLNVKKGSTNQVLKGPSVNSDKNRITYSFTATSDLKLDGNSIRVIKITNNKKLTDNSGYTLMNYTDQSGKLKPSDLPKGAAHNSDYYGISEDKQYKLDFNAPVISTTSEDLKNGIVRVTADIQEPNIKGSNVAFNVTISGSIGGTIKYQTALYDAYYDSEWNDLNNKAYTISAAAPINNGKSYLFFKIPSNTECKSLRIKATTVDEAKNYGASDKTVNFTYDNKKPEVTITEKDNGANISVKDTYLKYVGYAWTDKGSAAPSSYNQLNYPNNSSVSEPGGITENKIYHKTLWVKALDNSDNTTIISKDIDFDNRSTEIIITEDNNSYTGNSYPTANVEIKNAKSYWYIWAEKPVDYSSSKVKEMVESYIFVDENKNEKNFISNIAESKGYTGSATGDSKKFSSELSTDTSILMVDNTTKNFSRTVWDDKKSSTVKLLNEKTEFGDGTLYPWGINSDNTILITERASDSKRPIMLIVAAENEAGELIYSSQVFNTKYKTQEVTVRPYRFSTNDSAGNRNDSIRTGNSKNEGLFWYDDENNLNIPDLNDFAEIEFRIAGDTFYDLDNVDLENSRIVLCKQENYPYSGIYSSETELKEWSLGDQEIYKLCDGTVDSYKKGLNSIGDNLIGSRCSPIYGFTLAFDPSIIYPDYTTTVIDEDEEYTYNWEVLVTYEFRVELAYKDEETSTNEELAKFAFNKNAVNDIYLSDAASYDSAEHREHRIGGSMKPDEGTRAIFDNEGQDITSNIQTIEFKKGDALNLTFMLNKDSDLRSLYNEDLCTKDGSLGTGIAVRWSDSSENLSQIDENYNGEEGVFGYEEFSFDWTVYNCNISEIGSFPNSGDELKLYYQFVDYVKGYESPVYVIKFIKDSEAPVVNLNVSDTENSVQYVKASFENVYDQYKNELIYMDNDEADVFAYERYDEETDGDFDETDMIWAAYGDDLRLQSEYGGETDEPEEILPAKYMELFIYDEEEQEEPEEQVVRYVRVDPDDGGNYEFTRDGFLIVGTSDGAGNKPVCYVNGEEYEQGVVESKFDEEMYDEALKGGCVWYSVDNIDCVPPEFTEAPKCTNKDGYFELEAEIKDAENIYISYDKEYTDKLLGVDSGNATDSDMKWTLESAPGVYKSNYDKETGQLTATIYVEEGSDLSSFKLFAADEARNESEAEYTFTQHVNGKAIKITNDKGETDFPKYNYGESLNFTIPVKLDDYNTEFKMSHSDLPLTNDGIVTIQYTDLFGKTRSETIYADICGQAYAHSIVYKCDGKTISPSTKVNKDVSVTITPEEGITVDGESSKTITFEENASVEYTIKNPKVGERTYTLNIANIDKDVPEPSICVSFERDEDGLTETDLETGEEIFKEVVYSVTYSIVGFDKEGVKVIDALGNVAPSSITFDATFKDSYTFEFIDEAGNRGQKTVSPEGIEFADRSDMNIESYRVTYQSTGVNGLSTLATSMNGAVPEVFSTNSPVAVKIEALNAKGEIVPADISVNGTLPYGVSYYSKQKSLLFGKESDQTRTVSLKLKGKNNSVDANIVLPPGYMDVEAPKGTLKYTQSGSTIKAYLEILSDDIAPNNGVAVVGQTEGGKALELKKDENGYYVTFDANGNGYFILTDKAGNIGTVTISVQSVDTKAPKTSGESWYGITQAISRDSTFKSDLATLLAKPTNNSIKLFFSFNEQLGKAEVAAWDKEGGTKYQNTSDYIKYSISGNALTVEFLQNCQAQITVYDLVGNVTTLWRPEDDPVTCIDKVSPEPIKTPEKTVDNNVVTLTYDFPDDDPVMLLNDGNENKAYKSKQVISIKENCTKVFTFADKAGNIYTDYVTIDDIDDTAPTIEMSLDYDGEGKTLSGNDAYIAGNLYTSRNVRILMNIKDDKNQDSMTITASTLGGKAVEVKKASPAIASGGKSFNYYIIAEENDLFKIVATDKFGNSNKADTQITTIDKNPPYLLVGKKVIAKTGISKADAEKLILEGVESEDSQSGANNPIGDKQVTGTKGVTLTADLSTIDLNTEGSYGVKITAADRLGNSVSKNRTLIISNSGNMKLKINNEAIDAEDTYIGDKGRITVSPYEGFNGNVNMYWSYGWKTRGEMKNAKPFTEGFNADKDGYYTIMAQDANRNMVLTYVFVY